MEEGGGGVTIEKFHNISPTNQIIPLRTSFHGYAVSGEESCFLFYSILRAPFPLLTSVRFHQSSPVLTEPKESRKKSVSELFCKTRNPQNNFCVYTIIVYFRSFFFLGVVMIFLFNFLPYLILNKASRLLLTATFDLEHSRMMKVSRYRSQRSLLVIALFYSNELRCINPFPE